MARKRDISPGIWASEQFIGLSEPWARLLFIGCISNADDDGRLKASPAYLKTIIFPGDSCPPTDVQRWRDSLAEQRLIIVYQVDGVEYLALPTWRKHQHVSKYYPSRLPAPPVDNHDVTMTLPVAYHDVTSKGRKPDPDPDPDPDPEAGPVSPYPQPTKIPAAAATQDSPGNVAMSYEDKPAPTLTIKDALGEIATIYEQNIGDLTPLIGDLLKDMVAEYGGDWTRDALTEAVAANVRKPKYVAAILKRWAAEGRGPPGNNGHGGKKKDTLEEDLKNWTGR